MFHFDKTVNVQHVMLATFSLRLYSLKLASSCIIDVEAKRKRRTRHRWNVKDDMTASQPSSYMDPE